MKFGFSEVSKRTRAIRLLIVLLIISATVCSALLIRLFGAQAGVSAASSGDITLVSAATDSGSKYFDNAYRSLCLVPLDKIAAYESNGGENGSNTLAKAFDGQDGNGKPGAYWQSSVANSDGFLSAVTVTFTEPVELDAIQYKNLAYNTSGGDRFFWGYPTTLNVYAAIGDDDFVPVGTCNSTPVKTGTVNVVFALPQKVPCDRVKLEFAEIGASNGGAKAAASEISFFKYAGDILSPMRATGNYADANWLNLNAVSADDMTYYCNGGEASDKPLSNAFDKNASSYWLSQSANTAQFTNKVTAIFDNSKALDGIVLYAAYSTAGNGTRTFWGFPTLFKIYASATGGTDDLTLVATFAGTPANNWDKVVFKLAEAISCKRIVLEFAAVTSCSNIPNGAVQMGDILFIRPPDVGVSEIGDMFVDYSQTELKPEYKNRSKIDELRAKAKQTGNYDTAYKPILDRADAIISGALKKDVWREFSTEDGARNMIGQYGNAQQYARNVLKFVRSPSNRQVTGLGGTTGETITVYVEADETVERLPQIAFTQIKGRWQSYGSTRNLVRGKNVFEFPDFSYGCTDLSMGKGGPIHIINPYTRDEQGGDVRIYIEGGYNYPVFRDGDDEESFKVILREYVKRLKDPDDHTITVDCFEEIGGNLMGSVTATLAYEFFIQKGVSVQANLSEWIRCLKLIFAFGGINMDPTTPDYDPIVEHMPVNFRASQPYAGFFAFASGDHIGLPGRGTYETLVNKPKNQSWAMHHELGHILDKQGREWAETTNNMWAIYDTAMVEGVFNERMNTSKVAKELASDFTTQVVNKNRWQTTSYNCDIWWIIEGGHPGYWAKSERLFNHVNENGNPAKPLGITERWIYFASLATGDDMTEYFERWGYFMPNDNVYNAGNRFTADGASTTFKELMAEAKADGRITGGYKKYWYVDVEQYRQEYLHGGKLDASWAACYNASQVIEIRQIKTFAGRRDLILPEPKSKASHLCYEVQGYVGGEWKVLGITYGDIYSDSYDWGGETPKYKVYAYDRMLDHTGDPAVKSPETQAAQTAVCRIGVDYYDSLKAAVAAATAGDTIYLLKDFKDGGIAINKKLTILPDDSIPADGTITITKNAAGHLLTVQTNNINNFVTIGAVDRAKIILDGNEFSQSGALLYVCGANAGAWSSGQTRLFMNNAVLRNNINTGDGGGIYIGYIGYAKLDKCVIENNRASNGGGIFSIGSNPSWGRTELVFSDVIIRNNVANGNGGGIFQGSTSGASFYYSDAGVTAGRGITVENNTAQNGGGIYSQNRFGSNDNVVKPLKYLRVVNNTASGNGGGMYLEGDKVNTLIDPVVKGNTAKNAESSAIYFNTARADIDGGTIDGGVYKKAGYDLRFINNMPDLTEAEFTCALSRDGTPLVNSVTGVDLTDAQVSAAVAAIKVVNGHTEIAGTVINAKYNVAAVTFAFDGKTTVTERNWGQLTLPSALDGLSESKYVESYEIDGKTYAVGDKIYVDKALTVNAVVKDYYSVVLVYGTSTETIKVTQDFEYYLPMSTPDGSSVFGWDCSDGKYYAYAEGVKICRDTVFTAVVRQLFEVSFTVEGVKTTSEYGYGSAITLTEPASIFGKVFKYWEIDGKSYKKDYSMRVTENIDAVAVYDDTWTVTMVTGDTETVQSYSDGDVITLEKPDDDAGRAFRYWKLGNAKLYAGTKYTVSSNALFVAVYDGGTPQVTVTMTVNINTDDGDGNGQEYHASPTATYVYGAQVTLNAPSLPAWASGKVVFSGWDINNVRYAAGDVVTATDSFEAVAAIYAIENVPNTDNYTVTVEENADGSGTTETEYTYAHGDKIFFYQPVCNVPGKAFSYWQIGDDKYAVGDVYTVTDDTTVTAVYGDVYTVTVVQTSGGREVEETHAYGSGGAFTVPKPVKADDGKMFSHWTVGGTRFSSGDVITVESNIAVRAVYEIIANHTVAVKKYIDGAMMTETQTLAYGSVFVLPEAASSRDAVFNYYDVDGVRYMPGAKLTVLRDAKVDAVYAFTFTVTVIRKSNDTVTEEKFEIPDGGKFTLPVGADTDAAKFSYWLVDGKRYDAGDVIEITWHTRIAAVYKTEIINPVGGEIAPPPADNDPDDAGDDPARVDEKRDRTNAVVGAVVGIVAGVIAVAATVGGVMFYKKRKGKRIN